MSCGEIILGNELRVVLDDIGAVSFLAVNDKNKKFTCEVWNTKELQ